MKKCVQCRAVIEQSVPLIVCSGGKRECPSCSLHGQHLCIIALRIHMYTYVMCSVHGRIFFLCSLCGRMI